MLDAALTRAILAVRIRFGEGSPGSVCPIHSPPGDSPYGVVDMVGNLRERIGGKPSPLEVPARGANWLDGREETTAFWMRMPTPKCRNDFMGFRCAADRIPE
jgi:hypothetical protein